MIKLFNKALPLLVCVAISVGILISCKKNSEVNSSQVQLLSFGPTGAKIGDTLRFIGNNLTQVTEIDFTGKNAVIQQSAFIKQSSNLILVIVPPQTEEGFVTLKTPNGNIVTKTKLNLSVLPSVTSITGQVRPGANVTINGNYLNWITRVTFANNKPVDSFVSKTINQLVVKVPDDAQTGPLVLSYGGTVPKDLQTADTLNVTLPIASSLSPNPVKHQTALTISGTDLDLTKQMLFTGVSAPVTSFVSQSANQIVVTIPASTKKGKITLVAASGVKTQSTVDLDLVLPAASSMTPNPIDPGANLTITGTNLDLVTSITFPNAPAVTSFVSQTATQIVVKVPAGVLRGKLILSVLNSTLTVQTPDVLEINGAVPPPTIAFPIYNDAVTSNWTSTGGWLGGGWGGTSDVNNTSIVRDGTKSVKIDYAGGYGSPFQLGGAKINLSPYTTFKISIYGGPGSGGKKINVALNSADSYTITLIEGKWTDYSIPISSMTSSTTLTDIWIKEYNGTGGFTIYVDDTGLN